MSFNPNPLWPRWIHSSFIDHFGTELEPHAPVYYEGFDHLLKEEPCRYEVEILGPDIKNPSKDWYDIEVKVLIRMFAAQGLQGKYKVMDLGGLALAALKCIDVFDYREDDNYNDTLATKQFYMEPNFSENRRAKFHYFGLIEPDTKLLQGGVAATYKTQVCYKG